jgi:hypothetical protein
MNEIDQREELIDKERKKEDKRVDKRTWSGYAEGETSRIKAAGTGQYTTGSIP